MSRPAVSQHLKVLKNAGLVSDKAEGTRRLYRINPKGVAAMRNYLDTFWTGALAPSGEPSKEEQEKKTCAPVSLKKPVTVKGRLSAR